MRRTSSGRIRRLDRALPPKAASFNPPYQTLTPRGGSRRPIEVLGRGEEDPLMTGDSERDYAFNRRVEILVD